MKGKGELKKADKSIWIGPHEPSYTEFGLPSTNTPTPSCTTDKAWIDKVRNSINIACPMDHPGGPCTIFRVPEHIRRLDRKAYGPMIASLGPFHHYPWESSLMSDHKWRCVRHLLSYHGSPQHANALLDKCLLELKKQDDKVRSCYSKEFSKHNAQDMALIMLLDGCFIIYLMLSYVRKKGMEEETKEEEKESLNKEIKGAEIEVKKVAEFQNKATEEDEGKKRGKHTIEIREPEVVLNIEEKDKKLEGPTVAGLFTLDLVVYDLLKLENQIPFFIIQVLYELLEPCKDKKINLVDLALQLFENIHPKESKSFKKKPLKEYHHLLHLFYSSRIPLKKPTRSTSARGHTLGAIEHMKSRWMKVETAFSWGALTFARRRPPGGNEHKWKEEDAPSQECRQGTPTSTPKWIPNAMELDRAGVKFKKNELADSFLSITFRQRKIKIIPLLCLSDLCLKFRSGQMEIPPLEIYDYTGDLFRNLIAFEQCYFDTEMYITVYAIFMDCIVDQAEDVRLLHLEGILEHRLSNDQVVAELFNQLGNQIHFTSEKIYLADQIEKVKEFYNFKWHKWLAALRRDYLGSPWAIISVFAAIILLLLTIEQSIFSVLSYFHPPKGS